MPAWACRRFLLSRLVAVLAIVAAGVLTLFATSASATVLHRPETRVAAVGLHATTRLGVHDQVLPGQRWARAPDAATTASGSSFTSSETSETGAASAASQVTTPAEDAVLPTATSEVPDGLASTAEPSAAAPDADAQAAGSDQPADVQNSDGANPDKESGQNSCPVPALVGGESFSANTQVMLANGATLPIDQVQVGDEVLATDTSTGVTAAHTVTALWVHHDTDLLDVTITTSGANSVIHTTADHLIFDERNHHWTEAKDMRRGDHVRTANGTVATVSSTATVAGSADMWDLTVNSVHDFYVVVAPNEGILVHNEDETCTESGPQANVGSTAAEDGAGVLQHSASDPLSALGSAAETNPDELSAAIAQIENAGGDVDFRPGQLGYSPGSAGSAGRLIFDPEGSYGALLHEMSHFADDEAAGFPGLASWLQDPGAMAASEANAYGAEIAYANAMGEPGIAAQLEVLRDARIAELSGQ
jgi:hypothetical protein